MTIKDKVEFPVRLPRFMSLAGVASRRESEKIIAAGRVRINGETITEPGRKVAAGDRVEVDGGVISLGRRYYIALNKPRGYVCTADDPHAEKIVFDLVKVSDARLFTAGRLDKESEGLLIITNDGDYAAKLTHPRYEITKRYIVKTDRPIPESKLQEIRRGIVDDGEKLRPVDVVRQSPRVYCFVLNEGKKREIRRLVSYTGCRTQMLKRIQIGKLELGDLESGKWRELSPEEIRNSLL